MEDTAADGGNRNAKRARVDDGGVCVACYAEPPRVALVPCGHLCLCRACAKAVGERDAGAPCPVCRGRVLRVLYVYSS